MEVLDLTASVDKENENEPQVTDGTLADFTKFIALRDFRCDFDIVLPEYLVGPGSENFAERLPAQLEFLVVRDLFRSISANAHKANSEKYMAALDKYLVFLRSLPRAAYQRYHLSFLRFIILYESSRLPGPLEKPFLQFIVKGIEWRNDEKIMWCNRIPFSFAEVGMSLTVYLVFIVRRWIFQSKSSETKRKLKKKEAKRVKELKSGLNLDSGEESN